MVARIGGRGKVEITLNTTQWEEGKRLALSYLAWSSTIALSINFLEGKPDELSRESHL
jgi:hypothetical protein